MHESEAASGHPSPSRTLSILRQVVGVRLRVGPATYGASGCSLMLLKYVVEASVLWNVGQQYFSPSMFLNPVGPARLALLNGAPEWLGWAWFVWTLPFLWIAITMSVRRAADAGASPWVGMVVLIPVVNLLFMLVMCFVPSRANATWSPRANVANSESPSQAALAVGASIIFGGFMLVLTVYANSSYGASLFFGTPLLMSSMASYMYNRQTPRGLGTSIALGVGSVFFAGIALLLFALEGVICVAMALPLVVPIGVFGGLLGKAIADATRAAQRGLAGCLMILPIIAAVESHVARPVEYVVTSSVTVSAVPEQVWRNVTSFPDIPEPDVWYFSWGIAAPRRARIEGERVGGTRYCEFTTGVFVEPITVWQPPYRLAFDVVDQPHPMFELSPYADVHPPHLDGSLQSNRGEFVLEDLGSGTTRLWGRTWYEVDMFPQWYWRLWCDTIIHRIHLRVLRHIEDVTENRPPSATDRGQQ